MLENAIKPNQIQEPPFPSSRYSTYQHIDNRFKSPIQPTSAKLNTADDSPMTALGMTALHLRIADFKFTHNFVICDRLSDTELILGIDVSEEILHFPCMGKEKNCYIQRDGKYLTYTRIGEHRRPQQVLLK